MPAIGHGLQRRRLGAALRDGEGAARMEGTAGRHVDRIGRIALQQDALAALAAAGHRGIADTSARV